MRRFNISIAFCFLLVLLSCGTVKDTELSGQGESGQNKTWEYKGIPILDKGCKTTDFPLLTYTPPSDRSFRSIFSGRVRNII